MKQPKTSLALVPVKKVTLSKEQKLQARARKRAQATVATWSDWDISRQREVAKGNIQQTVREEMQYFLDDPREFNKQRLMVWVNEYQKFMAMNVSDRRAQLLREEEEKELCRVSKEHALVRWDARLAEYAAAAKRYKGPPRNPDDPDAA